VASEYLTAENYSGVAQVDVRIISAIESVPQFSQSSYMAVIPENSPRGATVTNVTVCTHVIMRSLCMS